MFGCAQWEAAKEKLHHYKRRSPEKTDLYRIVFHGREKLPQVWEERFQGEYGVLRDEVLTTFDAYLNCGILEHGAARVYCDKCKHTLLVAFSCKMRICPSCTAKRAVMFAEHLYEEVVQETPCRHIVCTIPKRLRIYFRYDRSLNDILCKAAWGAIKEVLGNETGTPAAALTIQTAGEALNFHPHAHGCMANGLFAPDGTFTEFTTIDQASLEKHFAERVLAALAKQELITDEVVAQVLSQEHTGFSFWIGDTFLDKDSKRFVARYIERGPVALEKISISDHDENTITYTSNDGATTEFDALEFLALLSTHVAKPYESLTRYYGWWSCRARGERKKKEERTKKLQGERAPAITPLPEEPKSKASSTWAIGMQRIFEFDPLECPKCKGRMRVIAFIHDSAAITQIMDALGIPHYSPPTSIATGPPPRDEIFPDSFDTF